MNQHGLGIVAKRAAGYWALGLVLAVSAVLAGRLLLLVHRHAVNILFLDQWNLALALFNPTDRLTLFRWQHGPHRQGCGLFVSRWIGELSGWNTRAESFAITAILILALAAALLLKRALWQRWQASDVVLPLLFLSPVQYETLIGTPNPAHGALPLLLLLAYSLAWCLPGCALRLGLVLLLNLLLVYTGFGVFVGLITPVVLAAGCYRAHRAGDRRQAALTLAALALALLGSATFAIGYSPQPAIVPEIQAYSPCLGDYLRFVARMFGTFFGLTGPKGTLIVGGAVVLALAGACLFHGWSWLRNGEPASLVIGILTGFTLLFAVGSAMGRVCYGEEAATASRYMIYLVPGLLGLYFHCLSLSPALLRRLVLAGVVLAATYGGLPIHRHDARTMSYFSQGKRAWKAAYLATGSVEEADRRSHFRVYPDPATYELFHRQLDYLKERRANLFQPQS
jgi:hypothetical protein